MLGFQGKASRLFYSLFFFFFFWKTHWPSFHGVLNLLKVVNETRVDFAKFRRLAIFYNLLLKPDVDSVLLAKGGRKRVKSNKSSTDHPLNQAWNQSNINKIGQCFNFSNRGLGKTQKKKGAIFLIEKVSCIV